jgi:transcriptional regulator with XRE-family HTH domain
MKIPGTSRQHPNSETRPYDRDMAGRPPLTPPSECGAHLAALRKAAGLSQAQLADTVGIPQRTVSFYERQAGNLPSNILPKLADALGVSVEAIIGLDGNSGTSKRGPKSKLERQLEAVRQLPRSKQQQVSALLEAFVAQHEAKAF